MQAGQGLSRLRLTEGASKQAISLEVLVSRYVMAIDSGRCINCKACIVACQQRNKVPGGKSRNWVREIDDESRKSGVSVQPGACMHCDHPVCVFACPTGATYKGPDGAVEVDKDRCIGCGSCIKACPYGARFKNDVTGTADKCDYCREHSAPGQIPACVAVCTTHCRVFGDADDPDSDVAKLLASRKKVYVAARDCDTRPTLTYLDATTPTDWPQAVDSPTPIKLMEYASTGVKWTAGAALAGVIGVFFKQLVLPSDREHGHADEHQDKGGNA